MEQKAQSEKVTKVKRIIARIGTYNELRAINQYVSERHEVLKRREQDAKIQERWDKIAGLPIGSELGVNAHGYNQFPRGTLLEIDSFSTRGRKCVYLKAPNGKKYSFDRQSIYRYDIRRLDEINLQKMWDRGVLSL